MTKFKHGEDNPNFKHGEYNTGLYRQWNSMVVRTQNPKAGNWRYYGGRGIKLYEPFLDFLTYKQWAMPNGYKDGLEIDRIDNDKGYFPCNIQYVTRKINGRKTRRIKLTMPKATEIRKMYQSGEFSQRRLADIFNVSNTTVCFILQNKIWS